MTTAYTSLLGLALPVTGELNGTWGDVVNNSITNLLDSAIAGTTTLSTDADVTLTTTTGSANQAREAILLCSGARTAARAITAPAQSKIYTVINATTGGYAVTIRGAGPTTGISIPAGQTAVVVWNGSDFVDAGNYFNGNLKVNGTLSVTGASTLSGSLTVNGNTTLGDATTDVTTVNGQLWANATSSAYGVALGYPLGIKGTTSQTYMSFALSGQTLDTQGMIIGLDTSTANIIVRDNKALQFSTNDTTRAMLTSDGTTFALNTSPPARAGKALELYAGMSFCANSGATANLTQNAYWDGSNWTRKNAAVSGLLQLNDNEMTFYVGATGAAGSTISFPNSDLRVNSGGQTLIHSASATPSSGGTSYSPYLSVNGGSGNAAYFTISSAGSANLTVANSAGSGTRYLLSFDNGNTRVGDFWTTDGATLQLKTVSQITFPSTQYASSDAYTLDDYREGSWTPNWRTTGGGAITVSDSYAYYVKVGRMVYVKLGWFGATTSATSWSGTLRFDLPFAAYFPAAGRRDITATIANIGVFSTLGQDAFFIVDSSTAADCYSQNASNSWSSPGFSGNNSSVYLHISLTYEANA